MGTITAVDRLIFTLVFSVIIHLAIILGVSFDATSPPKNTPLISLDITLVKQQTQLAPEQADYLAQVNNEGGGLTDEKSPEPSPDAPIPVTEETASSTSTEAAPLADEPIPEPEPLTIVEPTPVIAEVHEIKPEPPKPVPEKPKPPAQQAKVVTQKVAKRKVEQVDLADIVEPLAAMPTLSASDIMFQARNEIDSLQQQLDNAAQSLSKRPKKRRISASTKEYAAAAYMKSWEMKVERIGNMNYPQEAKREGLNGSLMLSVDINPDGSVPPNGIVISRSSGYKVLDDAAVKIVRLGAPYAAIPENVLKSSDMLTIIRTWKFETNRGLSTR
ncbi:MAG: TonB family protein [Pseudomonadota bacterium]|nr:TonB family protein [Pseudomonadota bacterium]MDO7666995.1 TonB family protein [Pseudomonadota bacterium]MDO7711429.1 TonB family protein [Pseudomonadota bacterium]